MQEVQEGSSWQRNGGKTVSKFNNAHPKTKTNKQTNKQTNKIPGEFEGEKKGEKSQGNLGRRRGFKIR